MNMTPAAAPHARFFQLAYVSRDFAAAKALFADRYGVTKFQHFRSNAIFDVALAYQGDTMIEIITPHDKDDPLYREAQEHEGVFLHHLGYLIDEDEWLGLPARLEELGIAITRRSPEGSAVGFIYADTSRELGHQIEYVYLPADGGPYFTEVPRND